MKINYRPEIDGLRAIAVVAVILFHAQITVFGRQPFQGGFIGVDIFFVISGYLITSIILKELFNTGTFSFIYFYQRRIRRILPVLLLVMLVSMPFAWIYLLPSSFIELSKSIIYAIGFSSNFYFHHSGLEYFTVGSLFKPFLHTWSLSIEEQYYILIPLILILVFKFCRNYIIHFLIFGFIISLFFTELKIRSNPSETFYFLHTRMWELLAGSILAYYEITLGYRCRNNVLNKIFPGVGLILILQSIIFFNSSMLHPSFYTLSPVLGVCLIIWFSNKNEIITRFLSTKLFVGIGLISYSLYLWHYPLFAFVKINGFASGDILKKLSLIPTLVFLSILSYYLVEKKFRDKKLKFKNLFTQILFLFISLIIINYIVISKEGFPNRFEYLKTLNKNYEPDNLYLAKNRMKFNHSKNNFIEDNRYNLLVIGDSYAEDLSNLLNSNKDLSKKIDVVYINKKLKDILLQDTSILKKAEGIVFSYRWSQNNLKNFKDNIKMFKKFNKKIFLTSRSNEYKLYYNIHTLLDYKILFEKKKFEYFKLKKLYYENRTVNSESEINLKLKELSITEDFHYLNKEDYMCDDKKKECDYVSLDGSKLIYDYGHYTRSGIEFFGKKINDLNWLKLY